MSDNWEVSQNGMFPCNKEVMYEHDYDECCGDEPPVKKGEYREDERGIGHDWGIGG